MTIARSQGRLRQLGGLCLLIAMGLARADEYDDLRSKWATHLNGCRSINTDDPDAAAQFGLITAMAQGPWDSMRKEVGRTRLRDDQASATISAYITGCYSRQRAMAYAFSPQGSSLQGIAGLASDVIGGLDWLYAQRYTKKMTPYENWWDSDIGAAQHLVETVAMLNAQQSASQRFSCIRAVYSFCGDSTVATFYNADATGASRLGKAQVVVVCGVLGKSGTRIFQGRAAMNQVYPCVTSGDGFYRDGSFILHSDIFCTGSYGASSWTVVESNPFDVEVPSQVVSAMSGDKRVSFLIEAAANYGSNGWTQHASRNAASRNRYC